MELNVIPLWLGINTRSKISLIDIVELQSEF